MELVVGSKVVFINAALFSKFYHPEDGGSRFLQSVGTYLPHYTVPYSRGQ
jgi:hypothetical protein